LIYIKFERIARVWGRLPICSAESGLLLRCRAQQPTPAALICIKGIRVANR